MSKFFNIYSQAIVALLASTSYASPLQTRADTVYQAEDASVATLGGTFIASAITGFTGSGYADGFDAPSDKVLFTIDVDAETTYDASIYYSQADGTKTTTIILNDGEGQDVSLPPVDLWGSAAIGPLTLKQGSNTIEVRSNSGGYLLDSLTLKSV